MADTAVKIAVLTILAACALLTHAAASLTNADLAALKQLTRDYASWDYSGRPVEFRERLDYASYEEQRGLLLQLAALDWGGFWGDYWRKRGVPDLKTLRAFPRKEFWLRYHSGLDPSPRSAHDARPARVSVDVHSITDARGLAYVTFQTTYRGRATEKEGVFEVLRARMIDGEWRLLAFPKITAKLRQQLNSARAKKRTSR